MFTTAEAKKNNYTRTVNRKERLFFSNLLVISVTIFYERDRTNPFL